MQKALSLFEKGPLALVAGEGFEPRPLGYEPYDARLPRLRLSLAGAATSADRTDHISLRRLRLPRLKLSRRIRFTNRFTEQVFDLQIPHPSRPSAAAILGHRTVSGFARQRRLRSYPTLSRGTLAIITAARPVPGHRPRRCPAQALPRTRLLRDPWFIGPRAGGARD